MKMKTDILNCLVADSPFNKSQIAEKYGISRTTLNNILSDSDAKVSTIEALACRTRPTVF